MNEGTIEQPIYTGKQEYQPPPGYRDRLGRWLKPYFPSDDLIEVVNLTIELKRPLLLQGEPGCGKTLLARAIAYEFGQHYLEEDSWPYYAWNIKSTSRAVDGLYRYDAIARLRDAQLVGIDSTTLRDSLSVLETRDLLTRLKDRRKYRQWGALGNAMQSKTDRPVLLIDEIDKADIDFPNDLLLELDELRFEVPETGEEIAAGDRPPITIITSNSERPLPDAFLRRCLYYYVEFPKKDRLIQIVKLHHPLAVERETLVDAAVKRFSELRELLEKRRDGKPPGTSEFLDFMAVLLGKTPETALEDLEQLNQRLPLLSPLIKTKDDRDRYIEDS